MPSFPSDKKRYADNSNMYSLGIQVTKELFLLNYEPVVSVTDNFGVQR